MSKAFTPTFSINKNGETTYLVIDEADMLGIIEPVDLTIQNFKISEVLNNENKQIIEYDLIVTCPNILSRTLKQQFIVDKNDDTLITEKAVKVALNKSFISAISDNNQDSQKAKTTVEAAAKKASQKSSLSDTFKLDRSISWPRRIFKWFLRIFLTLLVLMFFGLLYLMFGGSGKAPSQQGAAYQMQNQTNEKFIQALSNTNSKDVIDIESQTRLTNETLKKMGLDPNKSTNIGCLSVDQK